METLISPANIGLLITGVFSIVLTTLAAIFARRGKKVEAREGRAPDVEQMWAQQEADRRMRQHMEDMWYKLWRAFQSYWRRVTLAVSKMDLPPEAAKLFELTSAEEKAINAQPPVD